MFFCTELYGLKGNGATKIGKILVVSVLEELPTLRRDKIRKLFVLYLNKL